MSSDRVVIAADAAGQVVLTVTGVLDGDAARTLLWAAASATSSSVRRLRIDLRGVHSVTSEGVHAVTGCRRLNDTLPEGVAFLVAGGAGSRALLESLTTAP
jgi:hypothetical protein